MISAQWATGKSGHRYRYYRCSKKRGVCSQPYIQEHFLAEQIQSRLKTISLCDAYTDWMLHKVTEFEREEVSVSQSEVQNLSDSIQANEARMEKLVSTYLDGDIAKEMYLTRKESIMRAILGSIGNLASCQPMRVSSLASSTAPSSASNR